MAEAEFCGAEGEVFDAENTGEDDADDVASDKSINGEAEKDGDDLDYNAGKFGEAETYVVDANMSQPHHSARNRLTEKCEDECDDNPENKLILFEIYKEGTDGDKNECRDDGENSAKTGICCQIGIQFSSFRDTLDRCLTESAVSYHIEDAEVCNEEIVNSH